ncbi:GNAT family N-acetyltransferase [Flavobacterium sp. JP2137]|uniref:GNAT family N-acetyltransferase n=1 Tax=Flavobacterium sp. JP2137 TaxID=3414510 RepID=UPI003D300C7E
MEHITIRRATTQDLESLQRIGRQTFSETFSTGNTDENLAAYLAQSFSTEKLTEELHKVDSEFYFALEQERVIGYLKLNTQGAQTEKLGEESLEIERIYVLKAFHGQKVGQLLFEKAHQVATDKKLTYIWLGVWEGNARAIQFYTKNGFVEFGQHAFQVGSDEQLDILMKKQLVYMDIQVVLETETAWLSPLAIDDFDALYAVASDAKIWEQHPNKDRWKRAVFANFFEGAIQSRGAYKITHKTTGNTVGSTRFYDYNAVDNSILIGYTFYAVSQWGKGLNTTVKKAMLDYAFQFVSKVYFHIGSTNIRSQIAISRLGAEKLREEEITYFGEAPKMNFIYQISKETWQDQRETF